jgi:asparagine synthetase B (glutamine-hydrolysing)
MCGIAGIISDEKDKIELSIAPMVNALEHRGPDAKKIFTSAGMGFGRLISPF